MRRIMLAALLAAACGSNAPKSSDYANKCANPRTGADPLTHRTYPDRQGSVADEKAFLRAWSDELYLWYREIPSSDPGQYATPVDYFGVLKTDAITPSGKPKDQFHFTYPTATWEALSQSGVSFGYGVQWAVVAPKPPREVVAVYNEPNSPAANASPPVARGASVLKVDGVDLAYGTDVNTLNAGLFPATEGETHTFSIMDSGSGTARDVSLTSAKVTSAPVQDVGTIDTASGKVGYMLFNDHLATAEAALIDAVNQLKPAGIADLVIDIRYNGGGYLDIAAELAYMIAGPGPTAGKFFEKTVFNDKYTSTNPVTGESLTPTPFPAQAYGFSASQGTPLPTLNLPRVFVLTGHGTCSASESILNGLRGVDVQVIGIGDTTCGKPYGFYPQDNCGTTYFSIQFQGVNQKGFGDYADGFVPAGPGASGLPGCQVADDYAHALGDPAEARLAAALNYRMTQTCPPAPARADFIPAPEAVVPKSVWQENRIYRR